MAGRKKPNWSSEPIIIDDDGDSDDQDDFMPIPPPKPLTRSISDPLPDVMIIGVKKPNKSNNRKRQRPPSSASTEDKYKAQAQAWKQMKKEPTGSPELKRSRSLPIPPPPPTTTTTTTEHDPEASWRRLGPSSQGPLTPMEVVAGMEEISNDAWKNSQDRPKSYYIRNWWHVINTVVSRWPHLLNEEELNIVRAFRGASEAAQRLYIRLASRKGPWFRIASISYPKEIPDVQAAVRELAACDPPFATVLTTEMMSNDKLHLASALAALQNPELKDIATKVGAGKDVVGATRQGLLARLSADGARTLFGASAVASLVSKKLKPGLVRLGAKPGQLFDRLAGRYFLEPGSADPGILIAVDAGTAKFPPTVLHPEVRVWPTRDAHLAYMSVCRLEQALDAVLSQRAGEVDWTVVEAMYNLADTVFADILKTRYPDYVPDYPIPDDVKDAVTHVTIAGCGGRVSPAVLKTTLAAQLDDAGLQVKTDPDGTTTVKLNLGGGAEDESEDQELEPTQVKNESEIVPGVKGALLRADDDDEEGEEEDGVVRAVKLLSKDEDQLAKAATKDHVAKRPKKIGTSWRSRGMSTGGFGGSGNLSGGGLTGGGFGITASVAAALLAEERSALANAIEEAADLTKLATGTDHGLDPVLSWFTDAAVWARIVSHAVTVVERREFHRPAAAARTYLRLLSSPFGRTRRGHWWHRLMIALESADYGGPVRALPAAAAGAGDPWTRPGVRGLLARKAARFAGGKMVQLPPLIGVKTRTFSANQIDPGGTKGGRTIWAAPDGSPVSVEEVALARYGARSRQWKGWHCESAGFTSIFGLLCYDVIFADIPGAFQTPCQTAPLDLRLPVFWTRREEMFTAKFEKIRSSTGQEIAAEMERVAFEHQGELIVGVNWEMVGSGLIEAVRVMDMSALACVMEGLARNYGVMASGMPDLFMWCEDEGEDSDDNEDKEVEGEADGSEGEGGKALPDHLRGRPRGARILLSEVKSPSDKLAEEQRETLQALARFGFAVEVCLIERSN